MAVTTAGATCLSSISWSDPRVDLFGVAPDASIWHKFYTGFDWQPFDSFERLSSVASPEICPSVTTWGEGRLDVFYVDEGKDQVGHIYYAGGGWGRDDLGRDDVLGLASTSWGEDRLDIVARTDQGSYIHRAWTGNSWYPSDDWEDFGGYFFSDPAMVSWGPGRVDIIGLDAYSGSLQHMYYQDGWSKWEDLGGGPFVGTPVATSWGEERVDFWAIDSEGVLNHIYWSGSEWSDWEQLGGDFTNTPKVVHWNISKIDIVGKGLDDGIFYLKSFDGSKWSPSGNDWYDLAGPFASEPALLAKHETNFLYVFGINDEGDLRMQIWTGYDWQPGHNETWPLGTATDPYKDSKSTNNLGRKFLGSFEL